LLLAAILGLQEYLALMQISGWQMGEGEKKWVQINSVELLG
jgi:hypothetical protein